MGVGFLIALIVSPHASFTIYTCSLANSENRLAANPALTWCSGQWHPASDQRQVLGAPDLGPVRSVQDLTDYPSFDCELILAVF
jgi:hypothetical protein